MRCRLAASIRCGPAASHIRCCCAVMAAFSTTQPCGASIAISFGCLPGAELVALPYYGFQRALFGGTECWIARLGYSGETGYELVVANAAASVLWQALLAEGADAGL